VTAHTRVTQPVGMPEESGPDGLLRVRLDVSYDGTDFHGWARQPGLRTVQAELETALRAVLRVPADVPVRAAVAGRTDAGVHAVGQVCHTDLLPDAFRRAGGSPADGVPDDGAAGVRRRLDGVLPADLRVRRVAVAPPGFDARWSALWREYTYLVADDPLDADPRARGFVLASRPLNVPLMDAAATSFLGEHDFAAFCRAREGASTVRTVQRIGWTRRPGAAGGAGLAEFRIRSDAFCHSMVRALVGSFLAVGAGRWPVSRPGRLLDAPRRVPEVSTAPAHGLTLVAVGYPADEALAGQAQRARRWRGAEPAGSGPAVR
jgi:tRNA pseudouridine38-40 synthase